MTIKVYAWPPVPVTGSEWTEIAPVQVSRSLITGAERISAVQRKRRLVTLQVAALGKPGNMGAGYVEMLKRLLEGIHAVRLRSYPINWHLDWLREQREREPLPLTWTAEGLDLGWTMPPETLLWFAAATLTGVIGTSGGWPAITVSGLPASRLVARPGEFITVRENSAATDSATAQVLAPAYSNASGVAVVRLFSALPYGGLVEMASSDTAVFRPVGEYPRAVQPVGAQWGYDWSFREVFEDEVGGFEEVDPWS